MGLLLALTLAGSALGWALHSAYQSSGGRADYQGLDQTLEDGALEDRALEDRGAGPVGGSQSGVRPASD